MITYGTLLKRKDFCFFLATQFLGAFNDNFYKMVVSLLVVHGATTGEPLSITAIVFIIPSILFSGYAGFLADRFSKRTVLIVTKMCEIIAMSCAFFALGMGSTVLMLVVLFIVATQAAFFSPAKYGILPEIVSTAELSRANGLLQMTTYLAILLGGVFGGILLSIFGNALHKITFALLAIAIMGSLCSFGIAKVIPASTRQLRFSPWGEIIQGMKLYRKQPLLFWVTMAIAYFWALGLAMQLNMVALGFLTLNFGPLAIACLQAVVGIGIGIGAMLAGRMSGDQIEPGLIPLGALLMGCGLLLLTEYHLSSTMVYLLFAFSGIAAGFYIVPLNALLQELPPDSEKGRMIATGNFLSGIAMLLSAFGTWVCYTYFQLTPVDLLMLFGIITLFLFVMTVKVFPDFFLRFLTFLITHTLYRVRMIGYPNVPKEGPALLVCNHVSYVDGMILSGAIPRFIRYLVLKDFYDHKLLHWLFKLAHAVPVKEGEYALTVAAFQQAKQALRDGHVVCIFAEGAITRTGQLLPFRKGFERMMEGMADVPIIPVYIDGLWNSIFAFRGGRVIWKLPKHFPIRVTISFGEALPGDSKAARVRRAVEELSAQVRFYNKDVKDTLSLRLLQMARRHYFKFCMADVRVHRLTYGEFIGHALILSNCLRKRYPNESVFGVLLPASAGAALINVALMFAGKTVINFPIPENEKVDEYYFMGDHKVNVIISDQEMMTLLKDHSPEIIDYADLCAMATKTKQWLARLAVFYLPLSLVLKWYADPTVDTDRTAGVCFSRGTGRGLRGAMLSHCGVIAKVQSHSSILHIKRKDRVLAVLPFSDAYGYVCNLWLPLLNGMGVVYYAHPAQDCDFAGKLMSQYKTTVIFARLAHYQAYLEDMRPTRFSYINYAILAGEALPDVFAEAFNEKFALELLDSYGCLEMGGAIAMNVPDVRRPGRIQRGMRAGSVGHALPGMAVRIVDVNTGEILPPLQKGLLLVRGLGMMQGYFGEEHLTHTVFRDGWYITGDLFIQDSDGFLFYKGRA